MTPIPFLRSSRGVLFFVVLFLCRLIQAQEIPKEYTRFVKKGDSLYTAKAYKASALAYSDAFRALGGKAYPDDRYNAACSWALAGYTDSAFYHLGRVAARGYLYDHRRMVNDTDLWTLRKDKQWSPLMRRVKQNHDSIFAKYNVPLMDLIDSLAAEDQKWRGLLREAGNHEIDTNVYSPRFLGHKMHVTDSLNYHACKQILTRYGFPNNDLVGKTACNRFWLLLQHQDLHPAFQDSALKLMKPEVDKGLASASDYAYLTDRVKVNTGQLQVYGTQMRLNKEETSYEPQPVIEPEKLNERRQAMGMGTIEKYIDTMNRTYYGSLRK